MSTRKSQIILWATEQSQKFIDMLPTDSQTVRGNYENIFAVCKYLVGRKKILRPTASEIYETALAQPFGYSKFPSARTIYNEYGEIPAFWRKAYVDILNAEVDPPPAFDQIVKWDAGHLDSDSQYIIGALQRICIELKRKLDASKELITDNVVINMDGISDDNGTTIGDLAVWLQTLEELGFAVGGLGLTVTRNTPPGTIIMETGLIEALQRMVSTFATLSRLSAARGSNEP